MQKIFKFLIVIFIFPLILSAQQVSTRNITLYLPHTDTKRLAVKNDRIVYTADDDIADVIYNKLKKHSKAPEYFELLHKNSYAESTRAAATVDISKMPLYTDSATAEYLTIYSIVNSLTSTGEIVTVKFTQNGMSEKDLYGLCDMRETFIPDYSFSFPQI